MQARHIQRRELFERLAGGLLVRLGAVAQPRRFPWPEFVLQTRAGPLRLSIHTGLGFETFLPGGDWPWVASRFDDEQAAVEILGPHRVNRFSGKWNHHYWQNWTEDFRAGLERLEDELARLTPRIKKTP